jgi:hypothetical protein
MSVGAGTAEDRMPDDGHRYESAQPFTVARPFPVPITPAALTSRLRQR